MSRKPCIVQVVGPSGSGKTSSIIVALRELKKRGYRVAVIKHTHHDVDVAHKDSWRFMNEGSADYSIVVMGSGERVAIFTRDWSISGVIEYLEDRVDAILVEGFKELHLGSKVEVSSASDFSSIAETIVRHVEICVSAESRTYS